MRSRKITKSKPVEKSKPLLNARKAPLLKAGHQITPIFGCGRSYYFHLAGNLHVVALVRDVLLDFVSLDSASFLAGNNSLVRAVVDGQFDGVQPVGEMIINKSAILSAFPWNHNLPKLPWNRR